MTRQKMFDTAVGGVLRQGGPSVRPSPKSLHRVACALRGMNGRKCSIGQLISDEMFKIDMEEPGIGLNEVLVQCGIIRSGDMGSYELAAQLRSAHDMAWTSATLNAGTDKDEKDFDENFIAHFRSHALRIAVSFDLDASILH